MKLARISIKVLVAICFIVPILVSCSKQEERLDVVKQLIITKPESGTLSLEQGDSYKISYRTVPEEAINTVPVVWSSSNEEVATVRNGRVNAYAQGKAQIKAQCGDAEAVVNLKVTAVSIESFIVPSSMNVLVGIPVLDWKKLTQ